MSELNLGSSIVEAPVPVYCLSCPSPAFIVEALSTLGLKSKTSRNSNFSPVTSEV